ncbi:MAG: NF038130 family PEP-CTERM protein [Planktothrix rubescens PR222]
MAASLKKLLIGTSVAVGMSAVASLPAKAASLDFNNSETNYATYTHNSNNLWIKGNEAAAISALTDNNIQTNVELNYTNETNSSSVGFTAKAGKHTAKVSSVTTKEFNAFQEEWLSGLLNAYQPLKNVWSASSQAFRDVALGAFKSSVGFGDPNIAEFSLDKTGAMSMKTLGFFDLKPKVNTLISDYSTEINKPLDQAKVGLSNVNSLISAIQNDSTYKLLSSKVYSTLTTSQKNALNGLNSQLSGFNTTKTDLNALIAKLNAAKQQVDSFNNALSQIQNLQISEIAKVELDGVSEYVYSFNAENSGFVAKDDGKSYSGVYSWSKAGTVAVPEPSTILGLIAVGGLFGAAKRNANKKA